VPRPISTWKLLPFSPLFSLNLVARLRSYERAQRESRVNLPLSPSLSVARASGILNRRRCTPLPSLALRFNQRANLSIGEYISRARNAARIDTDDIRSFGRTASRNEQTRRRLSQISQTSVDLDFASFFPLEF